VVKLDQNGEPLKPLPKELFVTQNGNSLPRPYYQAEPNRDDLNIGSEPKVVGHYVLQDTITVVRKIVTV
jgi:hypothetical protein